jgi:hypothetical protein
MEEYVNALDNQRSRHGVQCKVFLDDFKIISRTSSSDTILKFTNGLHAG